VHHCGRALSAAAVQDSSCSAHSWLQSIASAQAPSVAWQQCASAKQVLTAMVAP
jgi:hypothetical protein